MYVVLSAKGWSSARDYKMRFKNVLYAEDDPNDVFMFSRAFKRATLPAELHTVHDGEEAIDWLDGNGKYADREKFPLPDILILDLKMPKKSGFDVLEWARSKKEFQKLPVVILSSSDVPDDVQRAYRSGAMTYFVKSPAFQDVIHYLRVA
jgi:CheY-like chemotaxis protein